MKKLAIDNFTAVLPVTCNANCGFCPEKEMEEKASKDDWIEALVEHVNRTWHMGYDHISLSGGEPTMDLRFLSRTLEAIYERTPCKAVGITTNGVFLESEAKTRQLLEFLNETQAGRMVYFINISRHALDTTTNNRIMEVNYRHRLGDIAAFRGALDRVKSFRLNMVMTEHTDYEGLFSGLSSINGWLRENDIQIALRTDYDLERKEDELIPGWLKTLFERYFGTTQRLGGCPTCVTFGPKDPRYYHLILKGSNFEPTDHDQVCRDLICHQNGELYYDWMRNRPFKDTDDILWGELATSLTLSPTPNQSPVESKVTEELTRFEQEFNDPDKTKHYIDRLLKLLTPSGPVEDEEVASARNAAVEYLKDSPELVEFIYGKKSIVTLTAPTLACIERVIKDIETSIDEASRRRDNSPHSACGGPNRISLGLIQEPSGMSPHGFNATELHNGTVFADQLNNALAPHYREASTSCGGSGCGGSEDSGCGHVPSHSSCGRDFSRSRC